jgi:hypothetical protein
MSPLFPGWIHAPRIAVQDTEILKADSVTMIDFTSGQFSVSLSALSGTGRLCADGATAPRPAATQKPRTRTREERPSRTALLLVDDRCSVALGPADLLVGGSLAASKSSL